MGTISEYQRQQMASEAVGTPGLDQSGEILAKAIGASADQLIQRQQYLDKIQYTNAFYDYQKQDEIARVKLQKEYANDPDKFEEAYAAKSLELQNGIREALPERQRGSFELLTARRRATIEPANLKWKFDQQNKLALDRVEEGGTQLSLTAQSWVGSKSYLEGIAEYRERFKETDAPLLENPDVAERKYVSNATRMYIASMLDNNQGNAIQLRRDFEEDEDFKKEVLNALGPQGFKTAHEAAKKQVQSLMSEQTFDMLKKFSYDDEAMGKVAALFDAPAGLAVSQAQQDVIITENALESLKRDPNAAEYSAQIKVMEKELEQSRVMLEIATKRDRATVQTDYSTLAELQQKLFSATAGISTPKEQTKFSTQVARENAKTGHGLIHTLVLPFFSGEKEAVVANKSYSQHLESLYELKGEILARRNEGRINDKDATVLLRKIAAPLASLNEFDKVQGGNSSFVQAYNTFDNYARKASLRIPKGATATQVREARDAIRTRMVSIFAEKLHELNSVSQAMGEQGLDPGKKGTDVLIRSIIDDFNRGLDPMQYPGLKEGDIVMVKGRPTPFAGYSTDGRPVHQTPEGLDESLSNV